MVFKTHIRRFLVAVPVALVLTVSGGGRETQPSDVQVTLDSHKRLSLDVTVRSRAEGAVTLARWRLPWGNQRSMLLVPVSRDGECIDNKYFAEEYPEYEKVSIEANGTLSGEIDLQK